jgi:hypothetical protein
MQVSIAVELAGILPGDLTVAAVRDVVCPCLSFACACFAAGLIAAQVCGGHAFFAVVLHYSTG